MAAKTSTRSKMLKLSGHRKLRALIKERQTLSKRLIKLQETIEDHEDHLAIERAKKRDAGKPGIPWEEAKKILGLKF
jgi:uncharacterized membrane protein